jgi:hypothetical protein
MARFGSGIWERIGERGEEATNLHHRAANCGALLHSRESPIAAGWGQTRL